MLLITLSLSILSPVCSGSSKVLVALFVVKVITSPVLVNVWIVSMSSSLATFSGIPRSRLNVSPLKTILITLPSIEKSVILPKTGDKSAIKPLGLSSVTIIRDLLVSSTLKALIKSFVGRLTDRVRELVLKD